EKLSSRVSVFSVQVSAPSLLHPDTCLPAVLSGEAFAKSEALRAVAGHLKPSICPLIKPGDHIAV
ncbi:MAG: hypothetical protein PVI19_03160, partial [Syntrophobacterales bacterium]